jgi:nucleotide-binding universal stress UspA family protein
MFHRILVAFDGSGPARQAVNVAIEIGAKFQSELTVAFVRPAGEEPADPVLESLVPMTGEGKSFRAVVDDLRAEALTAGAASVEPAVLHGEAAEALLAWMDRHHPDLVVVGSRSLSRGQRFLQGSVSGTLVARARCPVLVVHSGWSVSSRPPARAAGASARPRPTSPT